MNQAVDPWIVDLDTGRNRQKNMAITVIETWISLTSIHKFRDPEEFHIVRANRRRPYNTPPYELSRHSLGDEG